MPSQLTARRAADEPNYVSFTIWQEQQNFQDWYTGDAFKEAHGGGSLWGFVDMLVNATFTLNGAPKPAFWHGLLPISTPGDLGDKRVEDGWRVVDADGKNTLPAEVRAWLSELGERSLTVKRLAPWPACPVPVHGRCILGRDKHHRAHRGPSLHAGFRCDQSLSHCRGERD